MNARSKEITHKIMSSIRSKNTKPEIMLSRALWHKNIRFRKHTKIIGKPDIAIKKYKIAIFVDGDFWHGNNWKIRKLPSLESEIQNYSLFWQEKILKNIKHDKDVNRKLKKDGWTVLRFWQSQIENDVDKCVNKIIKEIEKKRSI